MNRKSRVRSVSTFPNDFFVTWDFQNETDGDIAIFSTSFARYYWYFGKALFGLLIVSVQSLHQKPQINRQI